MGGCLDGGICLGIHGDEWTFELRGWSKVGLICGQFDEGMSRDGWKVLKVKLFNAWMCSGRISTQME